MTSKQKNSYTYMLINSLNGHVFYIGQGQHSRVDDHERNARKGEQTSLCDYIRQIWIDGGQVIRCIVRDNISEIEAIALEAQLIQIFDRENLENRADAARGRYGPRKMTESDHSRLSDIAKQGWKKRRESNRRVQERMRELA